ncbi:DUF624 domain-containing protein [Bacillus sp. FJAT-49705]|uniref:DUF624 domain-containing protein n=1 Tax=Cytobacillus citreus TaxID=2833586 RepID=A0ABS5NXX2_9BACI|nr:DUF624 domain-containing protein [Cytobacillus citreus]MBS4192456.1 DUF624 domain-containing protein [Cytobacillus citreus]
MLSISKLLKKSGHQIFLNILNVLGISICWSLFIVPAIFLLPFYWAIAYLAITFIPATTAVFAVMNQIAEGKKYKFGMFIKSFFHYFTRSFRIGLLFSLAVLIPLSQWWYYININNSYLIFIFSVFQTYLCLTFLSTQVYTIPILVAEDCKVIKAMNKSIKAFMGNTWYTIGLFVQIICITLLISLTVIGFFLLYISMLAIFVLNASKNLDFAKKEESISENRVEQTI